MYRCPRCDNKNELEVYVLVAKCYQCGGVWEIKTLEKEDNSGKD